jgi:hypothetical protein
MIADNFWSGGAGDIFGAIITLGVGGLIGFGTELWRARRKDNRERAEREEDLRGAARVVAEAFTNTADGFRAASQSGGSLDLWGKDPEALPAKLDLLRQNVDAQMWDFTIARPLAFIRDARVVQEKGQLLPPDECAEFAKILDKAAADLKQRYP